ncbi:hypothetical protein VTJ04DRAFT_3932 [Mycothermus thermophilus]|uniref:uncharacterized protein n=1 Tax=Humicola insolens TaxID=85995 RepID=UPI00374247A4
MPPPLLATVLSLLAFTRGALSHSHLAHVIINGQLYHGFDPRPNQNNHPARVGWSTTATDDGFVTPGNYSHPDIICHRGGVSPRAHAPVTAGGKVQVQWNGWPIGHVGPILTYIAPCGGLPGAEEGCTGVDKTDLRWTKIDDSMPPFRFTDATKPVSGRAQFPIGQVWATDALVEANNSWSVVIPRNIPPGPYVLRQEIVALHYAAKLNGAQNYPLCLNLWVEKGQQDQGEPFKFDAYDAREFYSEDHPGVLIDVMTMVGPRAVYRIPGPTVASGATRIPHSLQTSAETWVEGTPVAVTRATETVQMEITTTPAGQGAGVRTATPAMPTPTVTKRWKGRFEMGRP